jgi:chaperone required for assembly of F1-ATPase
MKRFYRQVEAVPAAGAWGIALDGKPVRTPARQALSLPTRPLADAVAAEWGAQGDRIEAATMSLTRLANTAIDRTRPQRTLVIEQVAAYANTDLLCYRAAAPPDHDALQRDRWQPLLDWLAAEYGAALLVTADVAPLEQPNEALLATFTAVARFDDFALTGLHAATTATGSVAIGLALSRGHIGAAEGWSLAQLDELYQSERWGEDAEAAARRAEIRDAIAAAAEFMMLSGPV